MWIVTKVDINGKYIIKYNDSYAINEKELRFKSERPNIRIAKIEKNDEQLENDFLIEKYIEV